METFVKDRPAGPGAYPHEAAGLRWLAVPGGVAVVEVAGVSEGRIEVRRLAPSALPGILGVAPRRLA